MDRITSQDVVVAYERLFGRAPLFAFDVVYSGRLSPYNMIVRKGQRTALFTLSKKWVGVGREIQLGCVQSLLLKLFGFAAVDDSWIGMYTTFMKHLDKGGEKTFEDEELARSFMRVKGAYFDGFFDDCTVRWGTSSFRQFGLYTYATDTITLSRLLQGTGDVLDYVMYHEMLHKKHKFISGRKRSTYHTLAFRQDEKKFKNFDAMQTQLQMLARKGKLKR